MKRAGLNLNPTTIGAVAIPLWSSQALFTTLSGAIPPFQLAAMAFAIGGCGGLAVMLSTGASIESWRQPWPVWLHGVGGLFTYHALYFLALKNAPPTEASLIGYLWPLLIVVFAALLPGERLRAAHLIGAFLGFAGAALLVTNGGQISIRAEDTFGYTCALGSAIVWAVYSVTSRRFASVPSQTITLFCIATSVLFFAAHTAFETTVWPSGMVQWIAVIGLGIGPLGLAFTVWDVGMKHGNMRLLGTASYAIPLLSTFLLVVFGVTPATLALLFATILIILGAIVAALYEKPQST